jgi:RimJ/RimL family protein N-acetyltransferase
VGRAAARALNVIEAEHRPAIANNQRGTEAWITEIRKHLRERRFDQVREALAALSLRASQCPGLLNTHQSAWVNRNRWALMPVWSSPVRHGLVCLRRSNSNDEGFFRSTYANAEFTRRFNRQPPWSGNLSRALAKYGEDPPALLGMLQWVVCLRDIPVGLISLSNLDYTNSRAEFSIGFPSPYSNGISYIACLLALDFAFFRVGLNKVYGYIYESNDQALQNGYRIGFMEEGFLADHFHFPGQGFASVHVLGLTRRQAAENSRLVNAIRRRIGADWLKQAPQHLC